MNRTTAIEVSKKLWIEGSSGVSVPIKQDGDYAC
jgi:hypothetical protein